MNSNTRNRYVFFFVCCAIIVLFLGSILIGSIIVAGVLGNENIATKFNFPRYYSMTELSGPPVIPGNVSYALYQTDAIKKGANINWTDMRNQGPYDCVVISDSFLASAGGQYFLKKIAYHHNLRILHIFTNHIEYCQGSPPSMLVLLTNNGFLRDVGAKYVILGIAERSLSTRIPIRGGINVSEELPGIPGSTNMNISPASSHSPPVVTGCSPSRGAAGSDVTITNLSGSGFLPGATVILGPDRNRVVASDVMVVSPNRITCRFSIPPETLPGRYHIQVINPDQKAGANKAFTVTAGNDSIEQTMRRKNGIPDTSIVFFKNILGSASRFTESIDTFFSDASENLTLLKTWIKNIILSLTGDATNDGSLRFAGLNESRFTHPLYASRLIYFKDDTSFQKMVFPEAVIVFDDQMDEIAYRLRKDNITLIFIPGVSAYSSYYVYIDDPPTLRDPFFEIMRCLDRSYIFVDTKQVADEKQARNVPDLSGIGDPAHWTWRLTDGIPDPIAISGSADEFSPSGTGEGMDEYADAVRAFREVIYERDCRDTWALNNDARLYLKENNTVKALSLYKKSLKIDPNQRDIIKKVQNLT